ncbi:hypothetical protein HGA64_02925, partial [Candidatus Falkowbacteria bacterium]|nr:hypothetical protein [Candidatus Falkowbacteria bacterium]
MDGNIVINLQPIYDFLALPPDTMMIRIFVLFGWIPLVVTFLWGIVLVWVDYRNGIFASKQKFIFLAIDVPRGNEQSPKAVENLFTYLAGGHGSLNLIDTYWEGKYQLGFSFEIVSIEGYTQFVIRTPEPFRHLVETAIYSQYPDAEITEINDYTTDMPDTFPDDEWDVWGAEFVQVKPFVYPIKTYKEFEHQYGPPETHFRDPMSTLMDLCSSLHAGEQLWYQILVTPTDFEWAKQGEVEISKILKEKPKAKPSTVNKIIDEALGWIDAGAGTTLKPGASEAKPDAALKMMDLKPVQKKAVEGIQDKVSKMGFKFKMRMVYLAKKDVMNKPKVVNGFVGFIKQFSFNDLNNLKPDMNVTATSTAYLFKDSRLLARKNRNVKRYKGRSGYGAPAGFMNSEELATLWHFPIEHVVKAPMLQKA